MTEETVAGTEQYVYDVFRIAAPFKKYAQFNRVNVVQPAELGCFPNYVTAL